MKKRIGIILLVIVALAIPYVKYVRKAQAACDPLATPTFTARGNFTRCFTNQCAWNVCVQSFIDEVSTRVALLGVALNPGEFLDKGNQVYDIKSYGAVGNGSTDDTIAINAAYTACNANSRDGTVYWPAGTYKTTATINATNCRTRGAGMVNAVLAPTTALAGSSAVIFSAPSNGGGLHQGGFEDIQITGPSSAPAYGAHPSSLVNCLQLNNSTTLTRVRTTNCDKGIITNAATGHNYFYEVESTNNYYAVYKNHQSDGTDGQGDVYINSNFSASYAVIGLPPDTNMGALTGMGGTWGLSPYGIWQEGALTVCTGVGTPIPCCTGAGTGCALPMIGTLTLNNVYFEGMGNAVIYSNNIPAGGNGGLSSDIHIINPGFSYFSSANLPLSGAPCTAVGVPVQCCTGAGTGCSKAYGIQIGVLTGNIYEWPGFNPIDMSSVGGTGAISTTQCQGAVRIDLQTVAGGIVSCGTNPSFVQIGDGHNGWSTSGELPATVAPFPCATAAKGKRYFDSNLATPEVCFCNGTNWCKTSAPATCNSPTDC